MFAEKSQTFSDEIFFLSDCGEQIYLVHCSGFTKPKKLCCVSEQCPNLVFVALSKPGVLH